MISGSVSKVTFVVVVSCCVGLGNSDGDYYCSDQWSLRSVTERSYVYEAGEVGRNYAKTPLYSTAEFITTTSDEIRLMIFSWRARESRRFMCP